MKHPNPDIQKKQNEFLERCPENQKKFHAQLFRIGNATYRYHQLATSPDDETLRLYFQEWLLGLPANIASDMREKGFEKCKSVISFTRYINERQDIGMDEWMKSHLSEEDYNAYKKKE